MVAIRYPGRRIFSSGKSRIQPDITWASNRIHRGCTKSTQFAFWFRMSLNTKNGMKSLVGDSCVFVVVELLMSVVPFVVEASVNIVICFLFIPNQARLIRNRTLLRSFYVNQIISQQLSLELLNQSSLELLKLLVTSKTDGTWDPGKILGFLMNWHCQHNLKKHGDVKISLTTGMSGLCMVLDTFLIQFLVS